jgi:hypothetical protein
MSKFIITMAFLAGLALSSPASAWVISENATVDQIWGWQDDNPVYFKLSDGTMCYVPSTEKNLYSLILSLFATGKKATFHCWDSEETVAGVSGHRTHRVIATR